MKSKKPSVRIETVTPAKAKAWLKLNHPLQRTRREYKSAEYAGLMSAGEWLLSLQVIAFNRSGHLFNGQHTLDGVVASGVPIECIVARDFPDEAMLVTDTAMGRSFDDQARMMGRDYPYGCGSTLRVMIEGMNGRRKAYPNPFIDRLMGVFGPAVRFAHDALGSHRTRLNAGPVRGALARAFLASVSRQKLARFASVYMTGVASGDAETAAIALRNAVLLGHASTRTVYARLRLYGLAEIAILNFARGNPVRILKSAKNEQFPVPQLDELAESKTPMLLLPQTEARQAKEAA